MQFHKYKFSASFYFHSRILSNRIQFTQNNDSHTQIQFGFVAFVTFSAEELLTTHRLQTVSTVFFLSSSFCFSFFLVFAISLCNGQQTNASRCAVAVQYRIWFWLSDLKKNKINFIFRAHESHC